MLVADAYTKRIQDSLISEQAGKIVILQREKVATLSNLNGLLSNEQEKVKTANQISEHWKQVATSNEEQIKYYKKRERKARRERNLAIVGGLILVTLALVQ
jgi:hypothetical protein